MATKPKDTAKPPTTPKPRVTKAPPPLAWLDPKLLIVVGLDCPIEEYPDLQDPERLTLEIDPGMVADIAARGVLTPVRAILRTGKYYLVDGRRRTVSARQVPDIKIPVFIVESATDLDVAAANAYVAVEPPLVKARRSERLKRTGHKAEEIAQAMGVSRMQLTHYKHLLQCVQEILNRVDDGTLTPTIAYEIGKLPPGEQVAALAAIEGQGGTLKGKAGIDNVKAQVAASPDSNGSPGTRQPPRAKVKLPPTEKLVDLEFRLEPTDEDPYSSDEMKGAHRMLAFLTGKAAHSIFQDPDIIRSLKNSGLVAEAQ